MSKKFLVKDYSFNHLGFDVDVYPSNNPEEMTVSIHDPLHGVEIFHYPEIQVTAELIKFVIYKIQEKISQDEEV